jgi:hydroxylysine kinase
VSEKQAEELVMRLYGLEPKSIREFNSYDDRNFFFTACEAHKNEHLGHLCSDGYMLKVTNSRDSLQTAFFDAQNELMLHLVKHGLVVPQPIPNLKGQTKSLEMFGDAAYVVRVLTFIPGKILYDISPWTTEHFFQAGRFMATVDKVLSSFEHRAYDTRDSIWFLSSVPKLHDFITIKDEAKRALLKDIIGEYEQEVVPVIDQLEKAIIHGDPNEQNILVRPRPKTNGVYDIFSVIDFGDTQRNPVIFELALTIMYMMTQCTVIDPNLAGGHVVAGYETVRPLPALELSVLRTCVAARYAQSLILGNYTYEQDPGNEYLLTTSKTGWTTLQRFWALSKTDLYDQWRNIADTYAK